MQDLEALRTGLQLRKALVAVAFYIEEHSYYVLDVLVTVKPMSRSEMSRREKAMLLDNTSEETTREPDQSTNEQDVDLTQRTTHDIAQWITPRPNIRRGEHYPDHLTTLEVEILGPCSKFEIKGVFYNKVNSHIVCAALSIPPPLDQQRISFGRFRRIILNKILSCGAYQTPDSRTIAGDSSKIFIRPSRQGKEMQDMGISSETLWKYINERRLKLNSKKVQVYISVGTIDSHDVPVAIIEDDDIEAEDDLSQDIRDGNKELNSPAKNTSEVSNKSSREATQDVNEDAKKFVSKILSDIESPCYNSMSLEMSNHAEHYFAQKVYGTGMSYIILFY